MPEDAVIKVGPFDICHSPRYDQTELWRGRLTGSSVLGDVLEGMLRIQAALWDISSAAENGRLCYAAGGLGILLLMQGGRSEGVSRQRFCVNCWTEAQLPPASAWPTD